MAPLFGTPVIIYCVAGKLSILFWNVQRKDLTLEISNLINMHSIDIVVLAEMPGNADLTRGRIASLSGKPVFSKSKVGVPSKTQVFSINNSTFLVHRFEGRLGRVSLFESNYPLFPRMVLGTIHLVSKKNDTKESLAYEAGEVAADIRRECELIGPTELLLCGDFNLNPFDEGMMAARNFHAVMDKRLASRITTTIQEQQFPMLYSPMWSLFGDHPTGPPGTHYNSPPSHVTTHWHMVDQFLLSPQLMTQTEITELEIVATDGENSFLTKNGIISSERYSDHLPIRMTLRSKI